MFESWEGTHNVLCAQVLRDLERLDAVELAATRASAPDLEPRLRRSIDEPAWGALHVRRQIEELVRSLQVAELRGSEPQSAELLARRHPSPAGAPRTTPTTPR